MIGRQISTLPLCLLVAISGTEAQDISFIGEKTERAVLASEVSGDIIEFSIELSLDEAIRGALVNNLGFAQNKLSVLVANNAVTQAKAAFDVTFNSSVTRNANRQTGQITESGLITPDQETETLNYSIGVAKKLGLGTELSLTTSANRLDSNFGTGAVTRTSTTQASLRVTQPLLRNSGAAANKAALEAAELLALAAERSLGRDAIRLTVDVESEYWDLALAEKIEMLRVDSVILARKFVETTEQLYQRGRKSRLDLLEAQNGLAQREQDLVTARFDRVRLAEVLRLSIYGDVFATNAPLFTTRTMPTLPDSFPSLEQLEELAIMSRQDLLAAQDRVHSSEIDLAAARRNRLPQLNLVGSFGTGGTAEELSAAYTGLWDNQSPAWSVGVTMSMPFGNRSANANLVDASISRQRIAIQAALIEREIRLDVRDSYRSLSAAKRQLRIATENASTAEELLDAAEKRYRLGMIDLYRLLENERNTTESGVILLSRKHEVAKASARLRLAVGTNEVPGIARKHSYNQAERKTGADDECESGRLIRAFASSRQAETSSLSNTDNNLCNELGEER